MPSTIGKLLQDDKKLTFEQRKECRITISIILQREHENAFDTEYWNDSNKMRNVKELVSSLQSVVLRYNIVIIGNRWLKQNKSSQSG